MVDWTKEDQSFGNNQSDPRLSDFVEMVDLKDGKAHTFRLIGPSVKKAVHWIEINKKQGGTARLPRICLAYDPTTEEFSGECPYCDRLDNKARISVETNVIDREAQERAPRKIKPPTGSEKKLIEHFGEEAYYKSSKESESWTPDRYFTMSTSVSMKVLDLVETNKRKMRDGSKKKFGPEHKKYGFDIVVKFNKDREPANMYSVMKGDNTALTEEEIDYLRWKLDLEKPKKLAEAKKDADSLAKRLSGSSDDDDKSSKGSKGKGKKPDIDDDDFDDEEEDKKKKKSKSRSRDEDDEDEDEEEEDKPRGKSKKPSRSRDEDEEDEDEDERPKKKPKSKKSRDEEDDEDDEDEDERPKKKVKKKPRDEDEDDEEDEKPKKSSKKRRDEEEDEDDEEEEKPKKKKSKKPVDDEDDWDNDDD